MTPEPPSEVSQEDSKEYQEQIRLLEAKVKRKKWAARQAHIAQLEAKLAGLDEESPHRVNRPLEGNHGQKCA